MVGREPTKREESGRRRGLTIGGRRGLAGAGRGEGGTGRVPSAAPGTQQECGSGVTFTASLPLPTPAPSDNLQSPGSQRQPRGRPAPDMLRRPMSVPGSGGCAKVPVAQQRANILPWQWVPGPAGGGEDSNQRGSGGCAGLPSDSKMERSPSALSLDK